MSGDFRQARRISYQSTQEYQSVPAGVCQAGTGALVKQSGLANCRQAHRPSTFPTFHALFTFGLAVNQDREMPDKRHAHCNDASAQDMDVHFVVQKQCAVLCGNTTPAEQQVPTHSGSDERHLQ
jgi:hypothetical protein